MMNSREGETSATKNGAGGAIAQAALFLAWAAPSHTRRSELMARRLGIPLRRIRVLKKKNALLIPLRYAAQAALTLVTLFRRRPKVVFVQNPPIFAPLFAWVYCALTGSSLIIDSHTDALQSPTWRWSLSLHRFLSRRALTTLVTNEHLRQVVTGWGAPSHIIVDVPSDLPLGKPYPVAQPFNIAMVSSYAPDEPLDEVIQAARRLPEVGFYITGDPAWSTRPLPADMPPNVRLTGLLSDEEYYGLLRSAHAVMALTTADHTMQRGACEAVWLGQPIITSDWPVLRQAFHSGAVHVNNTVEGIQAGVLHMRIQYRQLADKVLRLQEERQQQWEDVITQLHSLVRPDSIGNGR
ncbi:MAG TPA: glycosyltransferase [Anaerolineae bacterium]|nr:glycosyltransferase [Anaerolineae bacterium]